MYQKINPVKIIRAYELQQWDIFVKQGVEYVVSKIIDGKIFFYLSSDTSKSSDNFIGAKSQEKLELVGRYTKKNTRSKIRVSY